jgi:excisionase family DNA binding protein
MESSEQLLTVQQVAKWLGMSVPWIYKATERGDLPYLRIGQAIRYDPGAIRSYLETRRNLKGNEHECKNSKLS